MADLEIFRISDLLTEIRDIIWTMCLSSILVQPVGRQYLHRDLECPGLIQALRPDQELYEEVLEVYYQINHFILGFSNISSFVQLKEHYITRLRHLIVSNR
jgi:hypothetical protein